MGPAATIRFEVLGPDQHRAVIEQCVPLKDLLVVQESPGTTGNQGNVQFVPVLRSALSSFCAFNDVGDIPKDDLRMRNAVTIRIEMSAPDQNPARMEQCLSLKEFLVT